MLIRTTPARSATTDRTEIDKSFISLNGGNGDFKRVYGNDDSVYLTVSTKEISADRNYVGGIAGEAIIIDDVDSVATGVQGVNITVFSKNDVDPTTGNSMDAKAVSYGVYTLFDDDGYVIAAVVVGEDAGSTTNYAFAISDDVNLESYDRTEDEYTWTREVVVNGEVVEISYVGDSLDEIDSATMKQGNWYEVKYYADGTVKTVNSISETAKVQVETKWWDTVDEIEKGTDTVIMEKATASKLSFIGSTLFPDNDASRGFAVSPNVKVVTAQKVDGKEYKNVNEYEGIDGMKRAINDLADGYKVEVSAIIEDGVATSVVIYNTVNDKTDEGTDITTGELTLGSVSYDSAKKRFVVNVKSTVGLTATDDSFEVSLTNEDGALVAEHADDFGSSKAANSTFEIYVPYNAVSGTGTYNVQVTITDKDGGTYVVDGVRVVA